MDYIDQYLANHPVTPAQVDAMLSTSQTALERLALLAQGVRDVDVMLELVGSITDLQREINALHALRLEQFKAEVL